MTVDRSKTLLRPPASKNEVPRVHKISLPSPDLARFLHSWASIMLCVRQTQKHPSTIANQCSIAPAVVGYQHESAAKRNAYLRLLSGTAAAAAALASASTCGHQARREDTSLPSKDIERVSAHRQTPPKLSANLPRREQDVSHENDIFFCGGGLTDTFQLLDKWWSQVSSLLPPCTCLQLLSRIGFSIPTARRFSSNVADSCFRAFRESICAREKAPANLYEYALGGTRTHEIHL